MADDQQNDAPDDSTDETEGEPQQQNEEQPPGADDIRKMQAALRKANREAEATRTKLKQYEDRDKTEMEKVAERATEAERRAQQAETALQRIRVATTKGLPPELADRLQGADEREMAADADRLLALVRPRNGTSVPKGPQGGGADQSMSDLIRQRAGRS
jgi:hypothetical protein